MIVRREALKALHRLLPMAVRAEELQVLQDRPIAFDVIDLSSGIAARSTLAAVTLDYVLPNRIRHLTPFSIESTTQNVSALDLNCLLNVRLPESAISDPLTVVANELSLVTTQLGAEEGDIRHG